MTFHINRIFLNLVFVVAILVPGSNAAANDAYLKGGFTGEEMLKYCKVTNDDSVRDFERGICTGFIDGFAAGHHVAELWHAFHHRDEDINNIYGHLCVPVDANRTALVALFVRYLENNPDNIKWNAGVFDLCFRPNQPLPHRGW